MNAPTASHALANPTITMLALAELRPSMTHIQQLRRDRFDPKLIDELAESIKSVGLLQPILCRPHAPKGHEIVAGERRYLAAKRAGMKEIPATVRDLNDEQVLEVQLIENLQREGLHELEEAEGYEELMKLKKISADAVADMVGRSRSYVFKRTKLLSLCPEARKAFYAGKLDVSKALLIARIGHQDTQREALKDITAENYDGPMSFREAKEHIEREYMLAMKTAPFKLDDATLVPKAGTCAACPKRTGNQKELFAEAKATDLCTDPKCFGEKRAAAEARVLADYKAKGIEIIVGDAAKRALPYQDNSPSGGFYLVGDTCYSDPKGRKYSELVDEKDVKVVLSPHTGKLVKVVHQSALPKAKKKAKARKEQGGSDSAVVAAVHAAILQAVHEKYSGDLTKPFLQQLVVEVGVAVENIYGEGAGLLEAHMAKAWGLKNGIPGSSGAPLPKAFLDMDAKKLARVAIEALVVLDLVESAGHRAGVICEALKIDRKAIEKKVRADLKAKADEAKKAKPAKKKGGR